MFNVYIFKGLSLTHLLKAGASPPPGGTWMQFGYDFTYIQIASKYAPIFNKENQAFFFFTFLNV